jgi:hypothetical protein
VENRQHQHADKNDGKRRQEIIARFDGEGAGTVARRHDELPAILTKFRVSHRYSICGLENIKQVSGAIYFKKTAVPGLIL